LLWTWISMLKCYNVLKTSLSVNVLRILRSQPTIVFGIQHTYQARLLPLILRPFWFWCNVSLYWQETFFFGRKKYRRFNNLYLDSNNRWSNILHFQLFFISSRKSRWPKCIFLSRYCHCGLYNKYLLRIYWSRMYHNSTIPLENVCL